MNTIPCNCHFISQQKQLLSRCSSGGACCNFADEHVLKTSRPVGARSYGVVRTSQVMLYFSLAQTAGARIGGGTNTSALRRGLTRWRWHAINRHSNLSLSLSFSLRLSLFWSQYKERRGGGYVKGERTRIWQLDVTGLVEHLPIFGVGGMREHPPPQQPTHPSTPPPPPPKLN